MNGLEGGARSAGEYWRMARADRDLASLVRDTYMDEDVRDAAQRFAASAEFAETMRRVHRYVDPTSALDLGAGNGIAASALLAHGVGTVTAVEPDPSGDIGAGAIRRLLGDQCQVIECLGEDMEVADDSVDLVYARQVLHHAHDLPRMLAECRRVLRDGGVLFAAREHVVESPEELQTFLSIHPMHSQTGGENAYSDAQYRRWIEGAGLRLTEVLAPWDSLINAFPHVRTPEEYRRRATTRLTERWGRLGSLIGVIPPARTLVARRMGRSRWPGCLFTYVAVK